MAKVKVISSKAYESDFGVSTLVTMVDENGNRINSADKILHFDYTGNKIVPALAKDWKVSADGKSVVTNDGEGIPVLSTFGIKKK